jgi:Peptidase family S41/N-terminal domain of Peptidase_S41 in eukaryotic IRBP
MRELLLAAVIGCSSIAFAQPQPAPTVALGGAAADTTVTRDDARKTALDLAGKLDEAYVFPEVAKRYSAMLRANVASGAYDNITSGRAFAQKLTEDLRAVSPDGHLRVTVAEPQPTMHNASAGPRPRFPWTPIEEQRWLAPGIAYIRFNVFPGDDATVAAVRDFMLKHAAAKTIIFDNRTHHGGGLAEMNAMFPYLFSKSTVLVTMDTREGVADLGDEPMVRKVVGPAGVSRREHFVEPSTTEKRLFKARVFVLTSPATGSAAEHMTLALKRTHRATIIGETTAGAGHYGGEVEVGDKFQAFIPVGRTFDPDTGKDWEGTGVAPDVAVPARDALVEALVRSGVKRDEAEKINAAVKPSGSMERKLPRRIAAAG